MPARTAAAAGIVPWVVEELPELAPNAALLAFLRRDARRPTSRFGAYGEWAECTRDDLRDWFQSLAPHRRVNAAYGVPVLANRGVAAAFAYGTSGLYVRIKPLPANVPSLGWPDEWDFRGDDWHWVDAYRPELSRDENVRVLSGLIAGALEYAGGLLPADVAQPEPPRPGTRRGKRRDGESPRRRWRGR